MEKIKLKILFNCTTNVKGGAVQNAANFIRLSLKDQHVRFVYCISKEIAQTLEAWGIDVSDMMILKSPAKSFSTRRLLKKISMQEDISLVYTMAGPSYVKFKKNHIMGISNPYLTHATLNNIISRRGRSALMFYIKTLYQGFYARKANYYIFQTRTSMVGFSKWRKDIESISYVVPNAISDLLSIKPEEIRTLNPKNPIIKKILVPSAYYPHKNIEIISDICNYAQKVCSTTLFKFYVTIEPEIFCKLPLSLNDSIENLGPYKHSELEKIYSKCDTVFMPSQLETFSTSYLEAMAFSKCLVVPDLKFAREICDTYPRYYQDNDVIGAYNALIGQSNEEHKKKAGKKVLEQFGDQKSRYKILIDIISECTEFTSYDR